LQLCIHHRWKTKRLLRIGWRLIQKRLLRSSLYVATWNRIDATKVIAGPKCGKCAKPILLERPIALDDETFARTINESDIPVAVDFYADWCGPCRMMAPAVDALAAHLQGKALIGKLNTDHSSRTASGFNIRGIPTTIVFVSGKEVARQSGAIPLEGLKQLVAKAGVAV
jgi:thioredoxin 2